MPFSTPISSTTVVLAEHPSDALDELAPLWGELLAHHVASAPHLSALGQVRTAAESWQIRREEYRAWLEEPHTKILTVTGHGQLLGYAFVRITPAAGSWKLGDRVGVLETLVVAAEARGGGLGRRLVEAVADHCKAHGAATMRISVIEGNDAHGFYARYGAVGFTNTLLLPLPEQCIQPSVGHSIPAQAAAVRWTVVEHVTVAKGAAPNEDRLLIADNGWLAVIDGATDKSGRSYGGMTGGARAAGRVAVTLSSLPADTAPPTPSPASPRAWPIFAPSGTSPRTTRSPPAPSLPFMHRNLTRSGASVTCTSPCALAIPGRTTRLPKPSTTYWPAPAPPTCTACWLRGTALTNSPAQIRAARSSCPSWSSRDGWRTAPAPMGTGYSTERMSPPAISRYFPSPGSRK